MRKLAVGKGGNDELGVNQRERAIFADKRLQRFEMRVMGKHDSFGEKTPGAPRLCDAAFAGFKRCHRRLVDKNMLAGGERRHHPAFMHGV